MNFIIDPLECKVRPPPRHKNPWNSGSVPGSQFMPVYCLNHQYFKIDSKIVLSDFLFAMVQEKLHSDFLSFIIDNLVPSESQLFIKKEKKETKKSFMT